MKYKQTENFALCQMLVIASYKSNVGSSILQVFSLKTATSDAYSLYMKDQIQQIKVTVKYNAVTASKKNSTNHILQDPDSLRKKKQEISQHPGCQFVSFIH